MKSSLTTTYVGRFQISFFVCRSFELETFHSCNQHIDGLMPKNSCEKKKISILGRVPKLAVVKWFLIATHVGRFGIYLFQYDIFGLEIWHICY